MMHQQQHQFKILVVGDLGTGKTSILKRYIHNTFSSSYKSTIGVDFALKVIQIDANTIVNVQLWDIAGQERFGNMTRAYYKGAVGAFVVCDVTRHATFENVVRWKQDIDSKIQMPQGEEDIPVILLANKIDRHVNPQSKHTMDMCCKENGFVRWFDTSAKEDIGIDEATQYLINYILRLESSKEEYNIDYTHKNVLLQDDTHVSGCC